MKCVNKSTNKKILPLESLRGIAALIVSLIHFQVAHTFLTQFTIIKNGGLLVDFFFVLSGFVIALNYWDKISTTSDLVQFQRKRFLRLYPIHLITLISLASFEIARFLAEMYSPGTIIKSAFSTSNAQAFLSNLFLTHSFTGDVPTFNGPSWSVSTEFYAYLLFALVLTTKSLRHGVIVSLIIISFIYLKYIQPDQPLDGPPHTLFVRCIYSFFIGVIGFQIYTKIKKTVSESVSIALLIVSYAAISTLAHTKSEIFVPILFVATIISIAKLDQESILYRLLSNSILVWIGTISYSIYMIHVPVWIVIGNILRFVVGVESDIVNGLRLFKFTQFEFVIVTLISIGLLLGGSHLSHRFIETRFTK